MKKTLILNSSVNKNELSVSNRVLEGFLKTYKSKNDDEIIIMDLNNEDLVPMSSKNLSTYYNEKAEQYIKQLKSVDKLIVVAPMYNFNISVTLKMYIDMICQANKTFTYKYAGKDNSKGLLSNLKVEIISAQGAPSDWYPWGATVNYLTKLFEFLGCTVHGSVTYYGSKVSGFDIDIIDFVELAKSEALSF